MYIITMESSISRFNNPLRDKRGFGLISHLIAVFVISISTLLIVKMSSTFIEKWIDFQILSTTETLRRNFEQVATSPTNILASIEIPELTLENELLEKCLKTGKCNSMNDYIGFSLHDITRGHAISSGEGINYDISGEVCPSSSAYCPLTVKSQIKAFCWTNNCGASGKDNTGFAVKYEISLNQQGHDTKKFEKLHLSQTLEVQKPPIN